MPIPESNSQHTDEGEGRSEWRRKATSFFRGLLYSLTIFAIFMIVVLAIVIDPAQYPG